MRTGVFVLGALLAALPIQAERRIALIVDTSRSMNQNDPPRYGAQIAKIVSDLVQDQDRIMIIRMPLEREALTMGGGVGGVTIPPINPNNPWEILGGVLRGRGGIPGVGGGGGGVMENCNAGPNSSLAVTLSGSDRVRFKDVIDGMMRNNTGTFFAQPVHTAMQFLGKDPSDMRLMLFVADSGGFETNCADQLTNVLSNVRRGGTRVALINLGSSAGQFHGNPAFDSTAAAPDSQALVRAVARVYQQFLGSKKVQTGSVRGPVTVEIDPYVKEAYLVVAAEGPIQPLNASGGSADAIDRDYHGGGITTGLDGGRRGYRIVKLTNPQAGRWTFNGPDLNDGGWMLLQDYSIALRAVTAQAAAGEPAAVMVEAIDERTGKRITDQGVLSGLSVQYNVGGRTVSARNNGDGTYSSEMNLGTGKHTVQARVISATIDRTLPMTIAVNEGGWNLVPLVQARAGINQQIPVRARLESSGGRAPLPGKILVDAGGDKLELTLQGNNEFAGTWTPKTKGSTIVKFRADSGNVPEVAVRVEVEEAALPPQPPAPPPPAVTLPPTTSPTTTAPPPSTPPTTTPRVTPPSAPPTPTATTEPPPPPPPPVALPEFRFGTPKRVSLGKLKSGATAEARLELDGSQIPGPADVQVTSDFDKKNLTLEIQTPSGWQKLGESPLLLRMDPSAPPSWPLRMSAAKCPAACDVSEVHKVSLAVSRADGRIDRVEAPVTVEVTPDPWLVCNWPYLAAGAGLLIAGFIFYGFYSPYRFGPRVGIQLSPEEDLTEGFYYALRAQSGSRSGFYRHARLFISSDYRISGKSRGAIAKLRAAGRNQVYIQPFNGQPLYRQRFDGEWEPVPQDEAPMRQGSMYRNDDSTIFFDMRVR